MRPQFILLSIMMVILLISIVLVSYKYNVSPKQDPSPKLPILEPLHNVEYIQNNIYLDKSDIGGRGVFAKEDIRKGDIIEIAPIILEELDNILSGSTIMNYVFFTDEDEDEYAIAFGYGSMYNHQRENNAYWTIDRDSLSITFKALKDIPKGSEVFVSYGDNYWSSRNEDPN
jgi:uncharacterized protein